MIFINLLLIQLIIVYIIDLSGVMDSIKWLAWRILFGKVGINNSSSLQLKPFTCSRCMSWWTMLLIIAFTPHLTFTLFIVYVFYAAMLSYLTTTSLNLLVLFKDMIDVLIIKLSDKINK